MALTNHASWIATLIETLERQQALVDRLADLAGSQAALVAERRTDRLLELLAQRQSLIDDITATQQGVAGLTDGLEERLSEAGAAQRERIRGLIDSIGARLSEVMDRDQQDQAALRRDRDQVREELEGVGAAKAARSAYAGAAHTASRFTDRQG